MSVDFVPLNAPTTPPAPKKRRGDQTPSVDFEPLGAIAPAPKKPPKPAPLSPLGRALEAFRIPGAVVGAEARDAAQGHARPDTQNLLRSLIPGVGPAMAAYGQVTGPHRERLIKALNEHPEDPRAALDEYYVTDNRNLSEVRRTGHGPLQAVARAALEHPYVTGAATLAGESVGNPLNVVTGEIAAPIARVARAAVPHIPLVGAPLHAGLSAVEGAASKYVGQPIANAIGSLTNRFHGVTKAAGEGGESWARAAAHATESAPQATADKAVEDVFGQHLAGTGNALTRALGAATGGLTKAQKTEIFRRAERDSTGRMLNAPREVPEPASGPTIQQRADAFHAIVRDTTQRRIDAGVLDPGRALEAYVPKNEYERRAPVYASRAAQDEAATAANGAALRPRSTPGGIARVAGNARRVHTGSLDEIEARLAARGEALFHPDFDPAVQLRHYVADAEHDIAGADALRGLEHVGTTVGPARVAVGMHFPNRPDLPLQAAGENPADTLRRAKNLADRTAGRRLTTEAATNIGRPDLAGGARIAGTSPSFAAWREARRAAQAAGGTAEGVTRATGALAGRLQNKGVTVAGVERGQGIAQRAAQRSGVRSDELETVYHDAKTDDVDRRRIEQYVAQNRATAAQRMLATMIDRPKPGYTLESDANLRYGSDFSAGRALQTDFFRHVTEAKSAGALPEDARGAAQFVALLNGFARRSMILVPTVHTVWNLGLGFLSRGGKPVEMAQALAGKIAPDYLGPELEARFQASGAASAMHFGSTLSRVRNATTPLAEMNPLRPVGDTLWAKAKDVLRRTGDAASKISDATVLGPDSRYVFDVVENGYARVLFRRLTAEQGLTDGAAAKAIRKVLGDYGNVTARERILQNVFFFYPWMKTAIPHWTKQLAKSPGPWFNAPMQGIRATNEAQGDVQDPKGPPRAWNSLTVGRTPQGDFRRLALPLPQRYGTDMLATVLGNGDPRKSPIYQRTAPLTNIVRGHANPIAAALMKLVLPGEARYERYATDKLSPTPEIVQGAEQALQGFVPPVQSIGAVAGEDPLGAAMGGVGLGFPSAHLPKAELARQKAIRTAYGPAIQAWRARGDEAKANELYLRMQALLHKRPAPEPAAP